MSLLIQKALLTLKSLFSEPLFNLITAVIILLVGFIIGRIVGKFIQKLLHEVQLNAALKKLNISMPLESILGIGASILIYFLSIAIAIKTLGLTSILLYIIAGISIVMLLISTLLAIKDFMPNFLAGFSVHKMVHVGDKVKIAGVQGKVISSGMTETEIKTEQGEIVYIPNAIMMKEILRVKQT